MTRHRDRRAANRFRSRRRHRQAEEDAGQETTANYHPFRTSLDREHVEATMVDIAEHDYADWVLTQGRAEPPPGWGQ